MQTSNRLFDDIAKMASGAMHLAGGLREEVETRVRERLERLAGEMDLVTREEFDAVKAMAARAREEQEVLTALVTRLERELTELKGAAEPTTVSGQAAAEPEVSAGKPARAKPKRKAAGAPDAPAPEAGLP